LFFTKNLSIFQSSIARHLFCRQDILKEFKEYPICRLLNNSVEQLHPNGGEPNWPLPKGKRYFKY